MALTFGNFHVNEEGERRKPGRPRLSPEGSPASDKKTSIYLKGDTLDAVRQTAARLDRSVSWVLARAFELSKDQLEAEIG